MCVCVCVLLLRSQQHVRDSEIGMEESQKSQWNGGKSISKHSILLKVGVRGGLPRPPMGSRGKAPGEGQRANPPEAEDFF